MVICYSSRQKSTYTIIPEKRSVCYLAIIFIVSVVMVQGGFYDGYRLGWGRTPPPLCPPALAGWGGVVQAMVPESPCLDVVAARGDGGWLP